MTSRFVRTLLVASIATAMAAGGCSSSGTSNAPDSVSVVSEQLMPNDDRPPPDASLSPDERKAKKLEQVKKAKQRAAADPEHVIACVSPDESELAGVIFLGAPVEGRDVDKLTKEKKDKACDEEFKGSRSS